MFTICNISFVLTYIMYITKNEPLLYYVSITVLKDFCLVSYYLATY